MQTFSTIDAHVAGEAVRLLAEGAPAVGGRTMEGKRAWMQKHADGLRRSLMLEPRGHAGMHGVLLTEPVTPGAHAGLLFMHTAGFPAFSGEAVIAAATIATENALIHTEADELVFDIPAGQIRARPKRLKNRVTSVAVTGMSSFVLTGGATVQLSNRAVRVDVAFGGELYAIVDSESVGIPLDAAHAPQLIRAALEINRAVGAVAEVRGTIFTGTPGVSSDLRSATVLEGGVLKRSPGVGGTCALMAVLDAMGLLIGDHAFAHEGVIGSVLTGRVLGREISTDGGQASVVAMVEGRAFITGRHAFQIDDKDGLEAFEI